MPGKFYNACAECHYQGKGAAYDYAAVLATLRRCCCCAAAVGQNPPSTPTSTARRAGFVVQYNGDCNVLHILDSDNKPEVKNKTDLRLTYMLESKLNALGKELGLV